MTRIVLYGIGSPVVGDVEESILRAGLTLAAGIRNRDVESFLLDKDREIALDDAGDDLKDLPHLVPLFTPGHRQQGANEAQERGFSNAFTLVDPTSILPRSLTLGPGCYINAGCSLGAASKFGTCVFINRAVSIGHHADVGDFVSIGPGVVIAGHVTIGRGCVLGAGAVVLPETTIGANSVIGGGAVVHGQVPSNSLVLGNPGKVVRKNIKGYHGLTVS